MSRRIWIKTEDIIPIIHEYKNGKTLSELERKYNYSRYVITSFFKRNKIDIISKPQVIECPDINKLKHLIEIKKLKYNECTIIFNVSISQIFNWCKRYNIITNTTKKYIDKDILQDMYVNKCMSMVDIGQFFDVSNVTIRNRFKEFNSEFLRTHSDNQKITIKKVQKTKLEKYGYENFPHNMIYQKHSKEELEVQNFLNEELGFNFQHSRIGRYDIDLYDKDKMFAVEYNGEYWHTEQFKKDKFLHYHKMLECQNHGIRLITINASEWRKRKNQVKGFLRASLGIFHLRIFARKCEVLEVDINIGKEFLKKYHIQGSSNSNKFIYGLFYDKELLGVVSFGLHHRNNKQIVLNRLVFKDGIQVVGGATKIVTNAMKHQNINEVVSWSDNRLSIGNVYEKMGFVLEEVLNPDYCYIGKEGQLHSKQSMKKSNTKCPSHITEKDFCISLGYYRMWDCGKKRWKLTINKEMHLHLSAVLK